MTISAKQAAEKCMNLGKQFQAVIDIGECLDRIGNLETAISEAKVATTTADSDRFAAEAKRTDVQEKVDQALKELQDAKNEAIKVLDDVNIARTRLTAQAREQANQIVATATKGANDSVKKGQDQVDILLVRRENLLKETEEISTSLDALRYEMRQLRERLG